MAVPGTETRIDRRPIIQSPWYDWPDQLWCRQIRHNWATKNAACKWSPKGIRVKFVCFGVVETDPDAKVIEQGVEVTSKQNTDGQALTVSGP